MIIIESMVFFASFVDFPTFSISLHRGRPGALKDSKRPGSSRTSWRPVNAFTSAMFHGDIRTLTIRVIQIISTYIYILGMYIYIYGYIYIYICIFNTCVCMHMYIYIDII